MTCLVHGELDLRDGAEFGEGLPDLVVRHLGLEAADKELSRPSLGLLDVDLLGVDGVVSGG